MISEQLIHSGTDVGHRYSLSVPWLPVKQCEFLYVCGCVLDLKIYTCIVELPFSPQALHETEVCSVSIIDMNEICIHLHFQAAKLNLEYFDDLMQGC